MTKPDRAQHQNRVAVPCPSKTTPNGHSIMLAEIGITISGVAGIYLWCKSCKKPHFVSIVQMEASLRELRENIVDEHQENTSTS
jgi:hypothetical protein